MAKICECWGCSNVGTTKGFSLLGKTVWLHAHCARVLVTALLELLNKGLSEETNG